MRAIVLGEYRAILLLLIYKHNSLFHISLFVCAQLSGCHGVFHFRFGFSFSFGLHFTSWGAFV